MLKEKLAKALLRNNIPFDKIHAGPSNSDRYCCIVVQQGTHLTVDISDCGCNVGRTFINGSTAKQFRQDVIKAASEVWLELFP